MYNMYVRHVMQQQHIIADRIDAMIADGTETLLTLDKYYKPDCSEKTLLNLRIIQFKSQYIRDIGIFDADGRLECTTGLEKLNKPIELPAPNNVINGFDIWWNLPITIGKRKISSVVRKYKRFNVVFDYNFVNNFKNDIKYNENMVALTWGNSAKIVASSDGFDSEKLGNYILNTPGEKRGYGVDFCISYSSIPVGRGTYTLHTLINCMDAARSQPALALTMFAASALLAILAGMMLSPRLRRLSRSKYRMKFLCRYENVICYYQPVMDMLANEIIGCEVLVRIRDGHNILYPDKILKDISEQGMTWALDSIVSKKALRELNERIAPNKPFRVAFNFFPEDVKYDLLSRHFDMQLSKCSKNFCVGIEVTEHSLSEEIIHEISRIKKMGYEVSVDDFGTGYSNLRIVKNIQPDIIKIDKSFVFDMEESSVRSSMIPQIIDIAATVGARVIAEGVENVEQRDLLLKLGVQYGQGYYFGRPMPLESFAQMYEEQIRAQADRRAEQKVVRIFPTT